MPKNNTKNGPYIIINRFANLVMHVKGYMIIYLCSRLF